MNISLWKWNLNIVFFKLFKNKDGNATQCILHIQKLNIINNPKIICDYIKDQYFKNVVCSFFLVKEWKTSQIQKYQLELHPAKIQKQTKLLSKRLILILYFYETYILFYVVAKVHFSFIFYKIFDV